VRGKEDKIVANIDWGILLIYFLIVLFGVSNIYSYVYNPENPGLFDLNTEHGKQLMWVGVSLFLGMIILFLESSFIRKFSYAAYGLTIFLLVAVLFMPAVNGAHSWFGIGGAGIQPSEFAKVGVALALARYLGKSKAQSQMSRNRAVNLGILDLWGLIPFVMKNFEVVAILLIPTALVLLQPDAGTCIIFSSFILVLYREGYAGNILLFLLIGVFMAIITLVVADDNFMFPVLDIKMSGKTGIVLSLLSLGIIFFFLIKYFVLKRNRRSLYKALVGSLFVAILFVNFIEVGYSKLLEPHQKERIDLFLGKIEDPDGMGYNINRAKAAIGSGGLLGKGYREATLANASQKHVPMQSTDFIFCTWSEERGFLGSFILVILYTVMLIKIVIIAERQRSRYTRIYAYGVAGVLFFHFMINIGMAIGLAPVIGIPLPYFSYGGSSMMAFSIMLFILVKLDSERKTVL